MDEQEIADFLAKRALEDPKVQQIVANAHLFDELKRSPAWAKLYELAKKQNLKVKAVLAERLWKGEKLTPEEVAYQKGFYQGCIWVLAHPEHAERSLETAARAAYLLSYDDPQSIEEATG